MSIFINELWIVLFGSFCGFFLADFIRDFIKEVRKAISKTKTTKPPEHYIIRKAYCNTNIATESDKKNNQVETIETLTLRLKKVCADNMNLRGTLREIRDYAAKQPKTAELIIIQEKIREVLK